MNNQYLQSVEKNNVPVALSYIKNYSSMPHNSRGFSGFRIACSLGHKEIVECYLKIFHEISPTEYANGFLVAYELDYQHIIKLFFDREIIYNTPKAHLYQLLESSTIPEYIANIIIQNELNPNKMFPDGKLLFSIINNQFSNLESNEHIMSLINNILLKTSDIPLIAFLSVQSSEFSDNQIYQFYLNLKKQILNNSLPDLKKIESFEIATQFLLEKHLTHLPEYYDLKININEVNQLKSLFQSYLLKKTLVNNDTNTQTKVVKI